jgi:hypothetical protein
VAIVSYDEKPGIHSIATTASTDTLSSILGPTNSQTPPDMIRIKKALELSYIRHKSVAKSHL